MKCRQFDPPVNIVMVTSRKIRYCPLGKTLPTPMVTSARFQKLLPTFHLVVHKYGNCCLYLSSF